MPKQSSRDFRAALERHFEAVYGYVAYRLEPDVEAAADVTQEVFLAAFRAWPDFRRNGPALHWLRAIARRKVADHFRERARREAALARRHQNDPPSPPADQAGEATLIAAVMKSIPPEYAELLEEKYLDGLSARQIARRRGKSEKAVESALARARQAFRQHHDRLRCYEERP